MSAVGTRVSLRVEDRTYDLVIPPSGRVSDVLAALGVGTSASPYAVVTVGGKLFGPHEVLANEDLEGALLTVVRMTTHQMTRDIVRGEDGSPVGAGARDLASASSGARAAATGRHARSTEVDESTRRRVDVDGATSPRSLLRSTRPEQAAARLVRPPSASTAADLRLIAAGFAIALLIALAAQGVFVGSGGPSNLSSTLFSAFACLVLAGTAVACVFTTGPALASRSARIIAPALAFAGGAALPLPQGPNSGLVAVIAGSVLALLLSGVVRLRGEGIDGAAKVSMGLFGGLAALGVLAAILHWPTSALAALVAGLSPMVVRMLPSVGMDVEDEQLIDVDRLANTVWAVREERPRRRRRVMPREIAERFVIARDMVSAGTLWTVVMGVVSYGLLWLTMSGDAPAQWWTTVALGAALACSFGYQSRGIRDRLPHFALIAGAAACVVITVGFLAATGSGARIALLVASLLILGAATTVGALAIGRGFRSARFSRLADLLELLAIVASLPLAMVASGGLEALRRITSG